MHVKRKTLEGIENCRRNHLITGVATSVCQSNIDELATEGWLRTSHTPAVELLRQFDGEPLAAVIYTDIETDGMLGGPNLAALRQIKDAINLPLVASGGITTCDDVGRLAELGVDGCIIGRALYEGTLSLADALVRACPTQTNF